MKKLNMESTIKIGTKDEKKVSDLVNEKGRIFSMIKEGYVFSDEVLNAANITNIIRDVQIKNIITDKSSEKVEKLRKDTVSAKQIISELNGFNKCSDEFKDDSGDNYENQIDNITFENDEE